MQLADERKEPRIIATSMANMRKLVEVNMAENLQELLHKAKGYKMTPKQREEQRRSFAYGNGKIENAKITRHSIDNAATELAVSHGSKD